MTPEQLTDIIKAISASPDDRDIKLYRALTRCMEALEFCKYGNAVRELNRMLERDRDAKA